jgi:hypothetical protein
MKTRLEDGRVFETMPFESIQEIPSESVYKFVFTTRDRIVKSSARHKWVVWNKKTSKIGMVRMDKIGIDKHELFVQCTK